MKRIFAALSVLAVMLMGFAAPAMANGHGHPKPEHVPVNVCHATSSDTNPFVFITVDDDSVKFAGHLMHRNEPNKHWKSDGFWNGVEHHAGDAKADLIGDYTDAAGNVHTYDGDITEAFCDADVVPPNCENSPSADLCPQPSSEHRSTTDTTKDCVSGKVVITTTIHRYTTAYVWDDESDTWVLGPEIEDFGSPFVTSEVTAQTCGPTTPAPDTARAWVTVNEPTCDKRGYANYHVENAFLSGISFDRSAGTHTAKFEAVDGAVFGNGTEFKRVTYTVPAAIGGCQVTTHNPPKHNAPPTTLTHLPNAGMEKDSVNYVPSYIGAGAALFLTGLLLLRRRRA